MFTGLIESVGKIAELTSRGDYTVITVSSDIPGQELTQGESVSCAGACLTVVEIQEGKFTVEASHETVSRTTINRYKVGSRINLERALKMGDRLGGHLVSGHIDSIGTVEYMKDVGQSIELAVKHSADYDIWVIEKGSISIDGVSLTINATGPGQFKVNIIPHTARHTTLGGLSSGFAVNLEYDLVGKYISKAVQAGTKTGLTIDDIIKSGW